MYAMKGCALSTILLPTACEHLSLYVLRERGMMVMIEIVIVMSLH